MDFAAVSKVYIIWFRLKLEKFTWEFNRALKNLTYGSSELVFMCTQVVLKADCTIIN